MSKKLEKLPEDHGCFGCKANCCDPVLSKGYVSLPLLPEHHLQNSPLSHSAFKEALDECVHFARKNIKVNIAMHQEEGGHIFSVKGYKIGKPEDHMISFYNREVQGQTVVYWLAPVTTLFDCKNFDKENRVCADYENRPEMCRERVKPEGCLVSPKYFPDADKNVVSKKELFHPTQPTIKKAIYDVLGWPQ